MNCQREQFVCCFTFLLRSCQTSDQRLILRFEAMLLPTICYTEEIRWIRALRSPTQQCESGRLINECPGCCGTVFMYVRPAGPWWSDKHRHSCCCQQICCKAAQLRTADTINSSGWLCRRRPPTSLPLWENSSSQSNSTAHPTSRSAERKPAHWWAHGHADKINSGRKVDHTNNIGGSTSIFWAKSFNSDSIKTSIIPTLGVVSVVRSDAVTMRKMVHFKIGTRNNYRNNTYTAIFLQCFSRSFF